MKAKKLVGQNKTVWVSKDPSCKTELKNVVIVQKKKPGKNGCNEDIFIKNNPFLGHTPYNM